MWRVFVNDGIDNPEFNFKNDEDAQYFMLSYLEDEILFPLCSFSERRKAISELTKSFKNRSQLKEGWGVPPYITVRWIEF